MMKKQISGMFAALAAGSSWATTPVIWDLGDAIGVEAMNTLLFDNGRAVASATPQQASARKQP